MAFLKYLLKGEMERKVKMVAMALQEGKVAIELAFCFDLFELFLI